MAVAEADVVSMTLAYLDQLDVIAQVTGEILSQIYRELSGYDRAQLAEWLDQATPIAQAGAAEGASTAAAYLAELTGVTPTGELVFTPAGLDDPFLRTWHDLKAGASYQDAIDGGASQAEAAGEASARGGAGERFAKPGVKVLGYQRVTHPGACEWCEVVSTQLYESIESGSFGHHNCRCIPPIPVTEDNAAALRTINRQQLRKLRQSGAVGRASAARKRSRARRP